MPKQTKEELSKVAEDRRVLALQLLDQLFREAQSKGRNGMSGVEVLFRDGFPKLVREKIDKGSSLMPIPQEYPSMQITENDKAVAAVVAKSLESLRKVAGKMDPSGLRWLSSALDWANMRYGHMPEFTDVIRKSDDEDDWDTVEIDEDLGAAFAELLHKGAAFDSSVKALAEISRTKEILAQAGN